MVKYSVFFLILFSIISYSLAGDKQNNIECSFSFLIKNGDISSLKNKNDNPTKGGDINSIKGKEKCFKMLDVMRGIEKDQNPNRELYLSISALIFGLVVLYGIFYFRKDKVEPEEIIKITGLTIIVTGTIFMISAGWQSSQIAPAMGLFGTLAGYLLAKEH